ncbi:MAG: hypothetical protein ABJJ37_05755 [Roseibium sp.]
MSAPVKLSLMRALALCTMARAVQLEFDAGRSQTGRPPPPWRIARKIGIKARHVRALYDGRFDRLDADTTGRLSRFHKTDRSAA